MKTRLLNLSIFLNAALLVTLALVLSQSHGQKQSAPIITSTYAPAADLSKQVAPKLAELSQKSVPSASESFSWSQLDAKDYHQYVKNLRAIGCPEATLRTIVTADVKAVWQVRIAALEKQIIAFEASSWTNQLAAPGTAEALKSELRQLPTEEIGEINELLGLQPVPVQVAEAPPASVPPRHPPAWASVPPSLPYVMQNLDLTALNLDRNQQQMVASLRQDFVDRIGGPNQDTNDPAYLARWQKAQAYDDSLLGAWLGNDAMNKIQMMQMSMESPQATAQ